MSVGVAAIVAVALALAAARAGVGTRAAGMAATACGIVPRSSAVRGPAADAESGVRNQSSTRA